MAEEKNDKLKKARIEMNYLTGDGDTIPVPKEFYYVGGNLNTGVIISDEKDDEYDEKIDKTTYEYTTNLKGNQFVWIP